MEVKAEVYFALQSGGGGGGGLGRMPGRATAYKTQRGKTQGLFVGLEQMTIRSGPRVLRPDETNGTQSTSGNHSP